MRDSLTDFLGHLVQGLRVASHMPESEGGVQIERVFSGAPWEPRVGYCRVAAAGPMVAVTGTAPLAEGSGVHAPGDPEAQAIRCFEIIRDSLAKLSIPLDRVFRTRMFVTDISQWEAFGRAHHRFFGAHPPATTMVEVSALIDPEMMIEIEADAWRG